MEIIPKKKIKTIQLDLQRKVQPKIKSLHQRAQKLPKVNSVSPAVRKISREMIILK